MEAKHVKDLMEAYASVYSQSEEVVSEETLEEKKIATGTGKKVMPSAEERSKLAKRARAGEDIGKKGKGFEAVAAKAAKQYGSKEAGKRVAAAAMFKAQAKEEVETDLFDHILEHLVAEGYANTNKAAIAIMANMSEEWKQDIVEGMTMKDFKANRKKLQRKEASDDAKKRGHVDRLTGKPYGTEEAASRRRNLNPAEREARREFGENPN
jgi:hypothetical protein